jgi:FtsP/CotA-like multicopper oxidase with cupredoxin domain
VSIAATLLLEPTLTRRSVNGITECPIPPNSTRTYRFIATQHGTTWYHSHTSGQYGDGIVGTIQISGPAIVNYDQDLGTFPIADYYALSMYEEEESAAPAGAKPPTADGGLINGTMQNTAGAGSYYNVTVKANTTYRLRLINTAVDNGFKVSLDGHNFTVIQSDFVPIIPYTTDWLLIHIGQRYDVVFTTNQTPGNYWFRVAVPEILCGRNSLASAGKFLAIFNYDSVPIADPTTTAVTAGPTVCTDETNLVPVTKKSVPQAEFVFAQDKTDQFNVTQGTDAANKVNQWTINK